MRRRPAMCAASLALVMTLSGCASVLTGVHSPAQPDTIDEDLVRSHRTFVAEWRAGAWERVVLAGRGVTIWQPDLSFIRSGEADEVLGALDEARGDGGKVRDIGSEQCFSSALLTGTLVAEDGASTEFTTAWQRTRSGRWELAEVWIFPRSASARARFEEGYRANPLHSRQPWSLSLEEMRDRCVRTPPLEAALAANAATRTFITASLDPFARDGSTWTDQRIRVGRRVAGPMWAEAVAGRASDLGTAVDGGSGPLLLGWSERSYALVATYEIGLARVGLGPAYTERAWVWRRGSRADGPDIGWRRRSVEGIVEGSVAVPVYAGMLVEARAHARTNPRILAEPVDDLPANRVRPGGSGGVQLGIGYRF
jgi:hypothetical protein